MFFQETFSTSIGIVLLASLLVARPAGIDDRSQEAVAKTTTKVEPYRFDPGAGLPALAIPRNERLVYDAYLDVVVEANVGEVVQTCTVTDQVAPVMLTTSAPPGQVAAIQLHAAGSYLWYEMESTLETHILPQDWPRLLFQSTSTSARGTRRREVQVGVKEDARVSSYRGDTSNGAPEGTRIWRKEKERAVPEGTLDMLSAVFMARALVREKRDTLTFPLIDKDRLWSLDLKRGSERRIETNAGTFDAFEVVLAPHPYPGESFPEKEKEFEGVFGIKGTIHLWAEKHTGIPVQIQGDLPLKAITLGINVVLKSYTGTPAEFAPVPVAKPR